MKRGSRRAAGEGTYEHLPSGLWRVIVRKDGKRITGPAKQTKGEARAALNAKLAEGRKAKSLSFLKTAQNYLATRPYSPTTKDTCNYWLVALAKDPLAEIPALDITASDLKAWSQRQKLAAVTIQKRLGWFRQILRDAGNPVTFSVKKDDHQRRPLNPRERDVLLERIQTAEAWIQTALLLAWQCGLRRSEICGLAHEDRDGDGFWVRRVALLAGKNVVVRARAKTARSHGWVPLPPSLIEIVGHGQGFVVGEGNKPRSPKQLSNAITEMVKGTILEKVPRMGAHALRRTYGMTLIEAGADIVTAAKAMRHDPAMLMGEYARSREDLMREAVKQAFPAPMTPHEVPRECG